MHQLLADCVWSCACDLIEILCDPEGEDLRLYDIHRDLVQVANSGQILVLTYRTIEEDEQRLQVKRCPGRERDNGLVGHWLEQRRTGVDNSILDSAFHSDDWFRSVLKRT